MVRVDAWRAASCVGVSKERPDLRHSVRSSGFDRGGTLGSTLQYGRAGSRG